MTIIVQCNFTRFFNILQIVGRIETRRVEGRGAMEIIEA